METPETPAKKLPGSAEPLPGRCGAKLHHWDDPSDDRYGRFCANGAGAGTPHKGEGTCKMHLGNTQKHLVKHERAAIEKSVRSLAEQLGEPEPIGDPMVELYNLAGKIKQWENIATEKMSELEELSATDRQGVERARAMVEIFERSIDRSAVMYKDLAKLGIMQYRATLEENHAKLLFKIINTVIESPEVGLTDDQIEIARDILYKEILRVGNRLTPNWFPEDLGSDEDDLIYDAEVV